jgi:hypothetical protein
MIPIAISCFDDSNSTIFNATNNKSFLYKTPSSTQNSSAHTNDNTTSYTTEAELEDLLNDVTKEKNKIYFLAFLNQDILPALLAFFIFFLSLREVITVGGLFLVDDLFFSLVTSFNKSSNSASVVYGSVKQIRYPDLRRPGNKSATS